MKLLRKKNLLIILCVSAVAIAFIFYYKNKEAFQTPNQCTITKPLGPAGGCLYLIQWTFQIGSNI